MNVDSTTLPIITPSGIQMSAELYAHLLDKFGSRCSIPRCNAPMSDFYFISEEGQDLASSNNYLALCHTHGSTVAGKLKSVFRSVRNLVGLAPGIPSKLLTSRKELLGELIHQLQASKYELRINYVGPLFCHPAWYHQRRDQLEGDVPNFDILFHKYLIDHPDKTTNIRVVLRNAKRYTEKISTLVSPVERASFKANVLQEINNIWGLDGEKGPSVACLEMGFFRHPMIFDEAVVEMVRDAPERPSVSGVVFTDSEYVAWERSNFDRVFEYSHRGQQQEVAALREFVEGLWA